MANNRHVKHIYKIYKEVIDNAQIDNSFIPIKILDLARLMNIILLKDYNIKDLINFFELFFKEE